MTTGLTVQVYLVYSTIGVQYHWNVSEIDECSKLSMVTDGLLLPIALCVLMTRLKNHLTRDLAEACATWRIGEASL